MQPRYGQHGMTISNDCYNTAGLLPSGMTSIAAAHVVEDLASWRICDSCDTRRQVPDTSTTSSLCARAILDADTLRLNERQESIRAHMRGPGCSNEKADVYRRVFDAEVRKACVKTAPACAKRRLERRTRGFEWEDRGRGYKRLLVECSAVRSRTTVDYQY